MALLMSVAVALATAPSAEAQNLSTLRLEVRKAEVVEGKQKLYFSFLDANQQAIKEVDLKKVKLLSFKGQKELTMSSPELKLLSDTQHPVAVVFLVANYPAFNNKNTQSLTAVQEFVSKMRPIDVAGVVHYAETPRSLPMTYDMNGLADSISAVKPGTNPKPRFFAAVSHAIRKFDKEVDTQKVDQRYLVIISDGYGSWAGKSNTASVDKKIAQTADKLEKMNITPLVVGFNPMTGPDDPGVQMLRQLASRARGTYRGPEDDDGVFTSVDASYQEIYSSHVLSYENFDMTPGQVHKIRLSAKVKALEAKSPPAEIYIPEPETDFTLWAIIGGSVCVVLGLLLLVIGVVVMVVRKKKAQPEAAPMPGPAPMMAGPGMAAPMAAAAPEDDYVDKPPPNYIGRLNCRTGKFSGRNYYIVGQQTTIGSADGNAIVIRHKSVSKKHAGIRVREGKRYELHDFGSTNGVFINGKRISKQFLKEKDLIRFGELEFEFFLE